MTNLTQFDIHADSPLIDEPSRSRPASRRFGRFLLAICTGIAVTLAWQTYGEATKQLIAKEAPELGWSPEAKQMIAASIQWLGWTKPPARPEAPATSPIDPLQIQQITQNLAALRETVDQIAAGQAQTSRDIARLQSVIAELILKIPERPAQPPGAPVHKPIPSPPAPIAPQSSQTPLPPARQ